MQTSSKRIQDTKNHCSEDNEIMATPMTESYASIFGQRFTLMLDHNGYPRQKSTRNEIIAHEFNVSTSAARKWSEGVAVPTYEKLLQMAKKFSVSLDWLLGHDDREPNLPAPNDAHLKAREEQLQQERIALNRQARLINKEKERLKKKGGLKEDSILVPVFSAGQHAAETRANSEPAKEVPFPIEWIQTGGQYSQDDLAMVQVNSDAMAPTLRAHDMVLIDMSVSELQENAIYVLRFGKTTMIRRIQPKLDGTAKIICDNSRYSEENVLIDNIAFNESRSIDHNAGSTKLTVIGKTLWAIKRYESAD